jgi:hypothetical protein
VLAGNVHDSGENNALTPGERARGYVLSCVAQPVGEVTLASAGRQVAAPRPVAAGMKQRFLAERVTARRNLRSGVAVATMGVFLGAWGLTHSAATTASSVSSGSSSSSSGASSSTDDASGSSSSSSSSNSGSITTQPSAGGPNSSTGTS